LKRAKIDLQYWSTCGGNPGERIKERRNPKSLDRFHQRFRPEGSKEEGYNIIGGKEWKIQPLSRPHPPEEGNLVGLGPIDKGTDNH